MKVPTCLGLFAALFLATQVAETWALSPPYACDRSNPATKAGLVFCDASKSIDLRVKDLISRLTLKEKVHQLNNHAQGVERLGIPKYEWWSEALHGVSKSGYGVLFNAGPIKNATSFPQVILSAASFNASLWYHIAQAISTEARAMFNGGQTAGLTFWSPNINIFRDPRWGRGQETPGEDPLVASKYSIAYVRGLQGDSMSGHHYATPLKASACCKHFTAYDLDDWKGYNRYSFDAMVSKQDLLDTYQPPFKSCVEGGRASGIMCSYNSVNGIPTCADYNLLTKIARQDWKFQGYIVSDCDAVSIIQTAHNYTRTAEDAAADVLKAGMDVNCGGHLQKYTIPAIQKGKLKESEVDRALHNLFSVRMRLGLFDKETSNHVYGHFNGKDVCSPKHQALALDAVRQGIVLLKNAPNHLPLSKTAIKSLAVIGPNANNATVMLGNYFGFPCKTVTPLDGLQRYVPNTLYAAGCENVACQSDSMIKEAVHISKKVDQVVLVIGIDQTQEKESQDRVNLNLPGAQEKLVRAVAATAKKPVVMVILSGGPVDVGFAVNDPHIGSIIWAGYPGEAGGQALAETIFGDHNPGGRLPMTWYPQEYVKIPMTNMNMRPNLKTGYPGRTYRFYNGHKVFEFGHGLSYSRHSYKFSSNTINSLKLKMTASNGESQESSTESELQSKVNVKSISCKELEFKCDIHVQNHGDLDGRHSVLLFSSSPSAHSGVPLKQLIAFENLSLMAGQNAKVSFDVKPCEHLGTFQEDGERILALGSHNLLVGDVQFPLLVEVA